MTRPRTNASMSERAGSSRRTRRTPGALLSKNERAILCLAGCIFLGIGLSLVYGIVWNSLYGYWRTRDGITVEARLNSVERHTSGRGSAATAARYDYRVDGQPYTGSRVTLFRVSTQFYRPLTSAWQAGTPIRVFIDPKHPGFSVIDREFSWGLIFLAAPFSLTFVGVGILLFVRVRHSPEPPGDLSESPSHG